MCHDIKNFSSGKTEFTQQNFNLKNLTQTKAVDMSALIVYNLTHC
jgi:hypothetical protein